MELRIKGLSKTYQNGVQALTDVNLEIPAGMFGLLGPNGAGKSTLMRTIATLQDADAGAIDFNGVDVLNEKDKIRRILGYLPQDFGIYPEVTAEHMLDHIALLKGVSKRRERKAIVGMLLEQTNLITVRGRKLGTYSGGMKQRFGIAQALLGDPGLIIVDEPTAGLDPEERNKFHNLLSEISENRVVILSTHIVDDVKELCSNMAVIQKGEVLLTGSPADAIASLDGHVWEKTIEKKELKDYQDRFEVIFTRLSAGKLLVHVLSDMRPGTGFTAVLPGLEDVYFSAIKNGRNHNGSRSHG